MSIGPIATGIRAGIATLAPFFLAAALGVPELRWMALGGWLGTLVDPGGSRATRAKAFAAFTVLGAGLLPIAQRCATSTILAAGFLAAVAFAATLARALGASAASVGTMTAIVVAIGTANGGGDRSFSSPLFFAAGAVWATVLSSIVWPIGTHVPVRSAVSRVYAELASYARAIDERARTATSGAEWRTIANAHQRRVRAAIEEALSVALAVRASRSGESSLGSDLRILIGLAETQFPALIALAAELEATPIVARSPAIPDALRALASGYDDVRNAVATPWPRRAERMAQRSTVDTGASHAGLSMRRLEADCERARGIARALGSGAEAIAEEEDPGRSTPRLSVAMLREEAREIGDAVSVRSVYFRHALRVAAAAGVASLVAHHIALQPHWVTIPTLAVLQPYPGPTWTRAAERVVGTVLGSFVAIAITMTVRGPLVLAALMFPLSVAAVATRARSHRLFTFFLTPVFVLVADAHPGSWWMAAARAGDTVIGGALAVMAALLLWPSWERTRLSDALDKMRTAAVSYRDLVLTTLEGPRDAATVDEIARARRAAGIALGEAETSLERALAEPLRRSKAAEHERAMQCITHARRLVNACTALDARAMHGAPDAPLAHTTHVDTIETTAAMMLRCT